MGRKSRLKKEKKSKGGVQKQKKGTTSTHHEENERDENSINASKHGPREIIVGNRVWFKTKTRANEAKWIRCILRRILPKEDFQVLTTDNEINTWCMIERIDDPSNEMSKWMNVKMNELRPDPYDCIAELEENTMVLMRMVTPSGYRMETMSNALNGFPSDHCTEWIDAKITSTFVMDMEYHDEMSDTDYMHRQGPFPHYACSRGTTIELIPHDKLGVSIVKHPGASTTFRFSIGDKVIINRKFAKYYPYRPEFPTKKQWVHGVVEETHCVFAPVYAPYKCSFEDSDRIYICYILIDNVEQIYGINETPRQRLLNAITTKTSYIDMPLLHLWDAIDDNDRSKYEKTHPDLLQYTISFDCCYEHIDDIVQSSDLDAGSFKEILIKKTLESANYCAVLWLEKRLFVNLRKICDDQGDGLLHQIVKSLQSEKFLQLSTGCSSDSYLYNFDRDSENLFLIRNKQGQTWIHSLIKSKQFKALQFIFSPCFIRHHYMFSQIFTTDCNVFSTLREAAMSAGCPMIVIKMIEEYELFHQMDSLEISLNSYSFRKDHPNGVDLSKILSSFSNLDKTSVAKRFLRHLLEKDKQTNQPSYNYRRIIEKLLSFGELDAFSWLLQSDERLLSFELNRCMTTANRNEFLPHESIEELHLNDRDMEKFNLISIITHGSNYPYHTNSIKKDERHSYHRNLQIWFESELAKVMSQIKSSDKEEKEQGFIERESLDMYLGKWSRGEDHGYMKYKLMLLRDDESLMKRMQLLQFLICDHHLNPPNPLDVVRYRQCGVLRWLVENSILDLRSKPTHENMKKLKFLGNAPVPPKMTLGVYLCFASIELDDLQTFIWLVEDRNIDISRISCNGWSAFHTCAHFGRTEIACWLIIHLQLHSQLKDIYRKPSGRKNTGGMLCSHIAVKEGFTALAKIFVSSGCPSEDQSGRSHIWYAKRSKDTHVKEWGHNEEKPALLNKDIQKLLDLIENCGNDGMSTFEQLMDYLNTSKCLYQSRWDGCWSIPFTTGPCGLTYFQIICLCLKAIKTSSQQDTLHFFQYVIELVYHDYSSQHLWDSWMPQRLTTSKYLSLSDMRSSIECRGHSQSIIDCLDMPWFSKAQALDPNLHNPILRAWRIEFKDEPLILSNIDFVGKMMIYETTLRELYQMVEQELRRLFTSGSVQGVEETRDILLQLPENSFGSRAIDYYDDRVNKLFNVYGDLNLEAYWKMEMHKDHPFSNMYLWNESRCSPYQCEKAYIFLAIEGYSEIISWSLRNHIKSWDKKKELSVIRIAAYLGHQNIIEIFLYGDHAFWSSITERYESAIFGAAESCRVNDFLSYIADLKSLGLHLPSDVLCEVESYDSIDIQLKKQEEELSCDETSRYKACSTIFLAVYGSTQILGRNISFKEYTPDPLKVVKEIIRQSDSSSMDLRLLWILCHVLENTYNDEGYRGICSFFHFLMNDIGINVWVHKVDVHRISEHFVGKYHFFCLSKSHDQRFSLWKEIITNWLEYLLEKGLEIGSLKVSTYSDKRDEMKKVLEYFQKKQVDAWQQFDVLKKGEPLSKIQSLVNSGDIDLKSRDYGGMLFIHTAATYDRLDVLEWLVEEKSQSLDALDGYGRNVYQSSVRSNASEISEWIMNKRSTDIVTRFVSSHYRRKAAVRKVQLYIQSVISLQAHYRGRSVRQVYRTKVVSRLEESDRFRSIWGSLLSTNMTVLMGSSISWEKIKQQRFDIKRSEDVFAEEEDSYDEELAGREKALGDATENVMRQEEGENEVESAPKDQDLDNKLNVTTSKMDSIEVGSLSQLNQVKLTHHALKWLQQSDGKYRQFFVRRIQQLAKGDRSRILSKRLSGSKSTIFETYLEQKSGHRILWTESEGMGLIIWYVAKHKTVSRLMSLIDDAENRSRRQFTLASNIEMDNTALDNSFCVDGQKMILDPQGDTPLKMYEIKNYEIPLLSDVAWSPPLYLTRKERDIVETEGTVCILGRSGTGKTVCIWNRMDYDSRRHVDPKTMGVGGFSQLFISRSQRLKNYVQEIVGCGSDIMDGDLQRKFMTFTELIQTLEFHFTRLNELNSLVSFVRSCKMTYQRFSRDVYLQTDSVDALIAWRNIQSFIKGSIESIQLGRPLTEDEYLSLGSRRCRLSLGHRKEVYKIFKRYQKICSDISLWDDSDRIANALRSLKALDKEDLRAVRHDKIYVDEIQDYTQAEIALFFLLSSPSDLFLAGDPAQNVVDGIEFRFEDIRIVGNALYSSHHKRNLILDKPKIVDVNFRSHSGILSLAGTILGKLFEIFPDAAKLTKDKGLFNGPRPSILSPVDPIIVKELVSKLDGVVILTHDNCVSKLRRLLDYQLVYGIKESKGLEFQAVILINFFVELPGTLQKQFRNIMLGRDTHTMETSFPEIEGYFKLLYTGVTRCIQRLFFAETSKSVAGDAFIRMITSTKYDDRSNASQKALAVRSNVEDVEKMVRSPDEWSSSGLDNAVMAESSSEDPKEALGWLEKAIYCFGRAGTVVDNLSRRARMHRLSCQFRLSLLEKSQEYDINSLPYDLEVMAAQRMKQLLEEGLFIELYHLYEELVPLLSEYTQEQLTKFLQPVILIDS